MTNHKSVLKEEILGLLHIKPDGVYVDLTLGGGGHSLEIAKKLVDGRLFSFEIDKVAIDRFKEKDNSKKIEVIESNFSNIRNVLSSRGIDKVDGIIADLGWSTDQLKDVDGLSFDNVDAELDMRFDKSLGVNASALLNVLSRYQLKSMLGKYADIYGREANRVVEAIITRRKSSSIKIVKDLTELLENEFGRNIGIKSRVFQALRIAVNDEYRNLTEMLEQSFDVLRKNGKFLVITFHSGEDKIVSMILSQKENEGAVDIITKNKDKNYLTPTLEELKSNISSRSAKLWGYEKL